LTFTCRLHVLDCDNTAIIELSRLFIRDWRTLRRTVEGGKRVHFLRRELLGDDSHLLEDIVLRPPLASSRVAIFHWVA
jgi:hypothetical protein